MELSIVIPAYLEEENLRILLPRIKQVLSELDPQGEIIIVDTMSPLDGTKDLCAQQGVRYVPRRGGNDYGDAIRTGIEEAQGLYTVFLDADGSHSPEFIKTLYQERKDYDCVVASRYVEGGHTENKAVLVWMSRLVNWAYAFVLNIKCKDVSNSFKLYRTSDLKSLELYCDHFDIIEEILFKLFRQNPHYKVKEIPFTFKQRLWGETKRNLFTFMISFALTLLKLRFSHLSRKKKEYENA